MKKIKNGFTLFEMLVVISIIAILTATITISFSAAQRKARDARRMDDMRSVQTAAEQFYALNNYLYPGTTNAPTDWTVNGQAVLNSFPKDPKTNPIKYQPYPASGIGVTSYCLCAQMEDAIGNSNTNLCNFGGGVGYFCVKSQQ